MFSLTSGVLVALVATGAVAGRIQRRQFGGTTQNGLDGACAGTTVIFARGTTEGGNVGSLAGPPFFNALSDMVNGDLAVQGVEYPANVAGFLAGGDAEGSALM